MPTFFISGQIIHRKNWTFVLITSRSLSFSANSLLSIHRAFDAKIGSESTFTFPTCNISGIVDNFLTE